MEATRKKLFFSFCGSNKGEQNRFLHIVSFFHFRFCTLALSEQVIQKDEPADLSALHILKL